MRLLWRGAISQLTLLSACVAFGFFVVYRLSMFPTQNVLQNVNRKSYDNELRIPDSKVDNKFKSNTEASKEGVVEKAVNNVTIDTVLTNIKTLPEFEIVNSTRIQKLPLTFQIEKIDRDKESNKTAKAGGISKIIPPKSKADEKATDSKLETKKKQQTEEIIFENPTYPQQFGYLLNNENICGNTPIVHIMIYVHTSPSHHEQRNIIRNTWGNLTLFHKVNVRLIFLVGKIVNDEKNTQKALKYEQMLYKDIVQGDFIDSYRNLTLKAIMGLKWVKSYCPQAKYVLKCDDDVFVNIFGWLRFLLVQQQNQKRFLSCYQWPHNAMHVMRDEKTCLKWCVDPKELVGRDTYPKYCAGAGLVISADLIADLYNASQHHPFFWVDDVYLTGLLPLTLSNVNYIKINQNFTMHQPTAHNNIVKSPTCNLLIAGAPNVETRYLFWKNAVEKKPKDLKIFGIE